MCKVGNNCLQMISFDSVFILLTSIFCLALLTTGSFLLFIRRDTAIVASSDLPTLTLLTVIHVIGTSLILIAHFVFVSKSFLRSSLLPWLISVLVLVNSVSVVILRFFRTCFKGELAKEAVENFVDFLNRNFLIVRNAEKVFSNPSKYSEHMNSITLPSNCGTNMKGDILKSPSDEIGTPEMSLSQKSLNQIANTRMSQVSTAKIVGNYQKRVWMLSKNLSIGYFSFCNGITLLIVFLISHRPEVELSLRIVNSVIGFVAIIFLSILFFVSRNRTRKNNIFSENIPHFVYILLYSLVLVGLYVSGKENSATHTGLSVESVLLLLLMAAQFLHSVIYISVRSYGELDCEMLSNMPIEDLRMELQSIISTATGFSALNEFLAGVSAGYQLLFIEAVEIFRNMTQSLLDMDRSSSVHDKVYLLKSMTLDVFRIFFDEGSAVQRFLFEFNCDDVWKLVHESVLSLESTMTKHDERENLEDFWEKIPSLFDEAQIVFLNSLSTFHLARFKSSHLYQVWKLSSNLSSFSVYPLSSQSLSGLPSKPTKLKIRRVAQSIASKHEKLLKDHQIQLLMYSPRPSATYSNFVTTLEPRNSGTVNKK